mgnify:CR=1 FL=1
MLVKNHNGTCSNLFTLQGGGRSGTYWLSHMQAGYTRSASIPVSAHPRRSVATGTRSYSTGRETVGVMVEWARPGKGTVSGIWGEEF